MSAFRHTFRLECNANKIGEVVDQITGVAMAPVRGEDTEIRVALFQGGALVPKSNITLISFKLIDSGGTTRIEWTQSGTALNPSLTVGAWRRGSDHMAAIVLNATDSLALIAGRYKLLVQAMLNSVPAGESGTVTFANADFDLVESPIGGIPSSPPTPGPPTAYTKAEADARYAVKATETEVDSTGDALADLAEWLEYTPGVPIKYVSAGAVQALTSAEKATGRANIGAALLQATSIQSLAAAASYVPTPAIHSRWQITLTGNATFANAASFPDWVPGKIYEWVITQDATGGRSLAWGNLYSFPTYAAIDPQPNGVTRLFGRWEGSFMRLWEAEPADPPVPDLMFHAGRSVVVNASDIFTLWGMAGGNSGASAGNNFMGTVQASTARVLTFGAGRPAISLTGAKDLRFTGPHKGATAAGCTVALCFDSSSSASPQYLACLGYLGVELGYNVTNGLYIAAVGAASGNRVALAFPGLAANTPCLFIGTIRPSASGGGMALDHLGVATYNAAGSMATPASLTTEYVWSLAGANNWNGKGNQVLTFSRALSWPEMVALRRALSREIGI